MPQKILFVCLGNICRSPTAEVVFRGLAERVNADVVVDSAGTSRWHNGELPDARAMQEAALRGYDLSPQRSRHVVAQDFEAFDLIIAMDNNNLRALKAMAPTGSRAEIRLMLEYAPDQPLREVPDPYYGDNFDGVFDLIETASRGLLASLSQGGA